MGPPGLCDSKCTGCDTEAQMFWDALGQCACVDHCATQCSDNMCAGAAPSSECETCGYANCGAEIAACIGDL
ncbi:MAG: hypothetical protein DRI90_13835 [Deltaproteobacteria bacterium]|nr:MAG: hypothetical protein DRI90_13835 [Deltaproteobacteria bacterium]